MDDNIGFISDILDSLDDLKISASLDETALAKVAAMGPNSPEFSSLVAQIANELAVLYDLEERVTLNTDDINQENFIFEISSLLSELGCPYPFLTKGDINLRLRDNTHCLTLLLYLTSELQAARMHFFQHPPSSTNTQVGSEAFKQLKNICLALRMAKPPDGISVDKFMDGIEKKVQESLTQCPPEHMSQPVIKHKLGPVHWKKLNFINTALRKEYETRRSMLLKRLDVTILSFNWSERAKSNVDGVAQAYQGRRRALKPDSDIAIADLLATRDDISAILKTASGTTRQQCAINKVVMGNVPDRGGRTSEINAPLPEMPSWQKRSDGGGGRGDQRSGGGFRGGSGGGRDGSGRGYRGEGGRGRGGYRGGGERPRGRGRRGGGNWGRGRGGGYQAGGGQFEQAFSHGGRQVSDGGFASGRQNYQS